MGVSEGGPRDAESDPWRWVVLAASFFTNLLNAGVSYNAGVLNVALLEDFQVDADTLSWLMALYSAMFALGGPLASAIVNATNCKWTVFLSGLMTSGGWLASCLVTHPAWFFLTLSLVGFGQSLAQVGSTVGLAYYFPTRTVFAAGIALSGNGFASFIHPALLQILLESYGLAGACLLLSGICLNSSICGLLMRPTPFEANRELDKKRAESKSLVVSVKSAWGEYREILTDWNFLRLLLAVFAFCLAFHTALVFLPECLIKSKGYSHMEAATIASTVGIGGLVSRTLVGFAAQEPRIGEKLAYVGLNSVFFLVGMAADFLMDYTAGAYFVAFAYGLYISPCVILFFTLSFYVLGYEKGASGYGIVLMVYGLATLLGPPIYAPLLQLFGCAALFKITGLLFLASALVGTGLHPYLPPGEDTSVRDEDQKSLTLGPEYRTSGAGPSLHGPDLPTELKDNVHVTVEEQLSVEPRGGGEAEEELKHLLISSDNKTETSA